MSSRTDSFAEGKEKYRLIEIFQRAGREKSMSQTELYQWTAQIKQVFSELGAWQAAGLGLYSYGVMVARQSGPSRVAEKLWEVGKADSVQRRLERWLANERIEWQQCCQAWAGWVLNCWQGEALFLLVDETKLGQQLSVMVVGLAYRGCCIPLAWWAYLPKAWPDGQVALITRLLNWIAPSVPPGVTPIVQADRGIGTSPDLIRAVEHMGWYYLFRVQNTTRWRAPDGTEQPLKELLSAPGGVWHGSGQAFKKVGWLSTTVHIVWGSAYREPWCLVTNCPTLDGWAYARRYWQEASFRDLKSDGWQWQTSRIYTPAHANRLLLVLALAYAYVLTLGSLAFDDPALRRLITKGTRPAFSIFRLGLRLTDLFLAQAIDLACSFFHFLDTPPPRPKTVGA